MRLGPECCSADREPSSFSNEKSLPRLDGETAFRCDERTVACLEEHFTTERGNDDCSSDDDCVFFGRKRSV